MKERKSPRKYSIQFKEDAVNLVMSGRGTREVARDLDVPVSCIDRWRKKHLQKLDTEHDGRGQSPSEMAAEIKQLRKELAHEREITAILKKTIKYVS